MQKEIENTLRPKQEEKDIKTTDCKGMHCEEMHSTEMAIKSMMEIAAYHSSGRVVDANL